MRIVGRGQSPRINQKGVLVEIVYVDRHVAPGQLQVGPATKVAGRNRSDLVKVFGRLVDDRQLVEIGALGEIARLSLIQSHLALDLENAGDQLPNQQQDDSGVQYDDPSLFPAKP